MKKITICDKTALHCTRVLRTENKTKVVSEITEALSNLNKNISLAKLDILINSQNKKHKNKNFNFHVIKNSLPNNSFIKINSQISIVCPELLLIQLARTLSFEKLCLIALEFCGTYSIREEIQTFQSDVLPITTAKSINNYLKIFTATHENF